MNFVVKTFAKDIAIAKDSPNWVGKLNTFRPETGSKDENLHLIVAGLKKREAEILKGKLNEANRDNASLADTIEVLKAKGVYEIVLSAKPEAFQPVPLPAEITLTLEELREGPKKAGRKAKEATEPTAETSTETEPETEENEEEGDETEE